MWPADARTGSGAVLLLRYFDFIWRLAGTGWAFTVFLGGGLVLAGVIFPVVDCVTAPINRRARYHFLLQLAFRGFVGMLRLLRVIDVVIDDPSALRNSKGVVVVANHPTLIDIVLLSALIPRAQCIVKRELWNSPFLGRIMRGCGYVPSDLEPDALLAACREALSDGRSLIIFPEGTRSRPGMPLRFRRGFAHIATLLDADIQMMTIDCNPPTLAKNDRWWVIPWRRPLFRVSPAGWVRAASWQGGDHRPKVVRGIVRQLERFYNERIAVG
jgi:1-acyl-sn-glycerol-3-phosphate acyltransferase